MHVYATPYESACMIFRSNKVPPISALFLTMVSSKSTDVKELFTVGIELEFVTSGDRKRIYDEIAGWLNSQPEEKGLQAIGVTDPAKQYPEKWVVKPDLSIEESDNRVDPPRVGVEIVSPVFIDYPANSDKEWKKRVGYLLDAVSEKYQIAVNKSTGFHAHIGLGIKSPKIGVEFTLIDLKKIAILYWMYEACFDALHPYHRGSLMSGRINIYIRSIRTNSELLDYQDDPQGVLDMIWGAQTVQQLCDIMNPIPTDLINIQRPEDHTRHYKVNFRSHPRTGTVEFRQHQGTMDKDAICTWVRFVLEFVRCALVTSEAKLKRWGVQPSTLEGFMLNNTSNKNSLYQSMIRSRDRLQRLQAQQS
ncbi:hypothetical protein OBBRIDRAFT_824486 [Obba rivulosa]|uniref:Amidoligase enzyme n=1 Tax=Obba rivulosa TaxID=1052685 RepID=A0A8E2AYF0_9APHY|nr:hypothetical protein OBBRIDRAFT_824486 [Obba rivulosa]